MMVGEPARWLGSGRGHHHLFFQVKISLHANSQLKRIHPRYIFDILMFFDYFLIQKELREGTRLVLGGGVKTRVTPGYPPNI